MKTELISVTSVLFAVILFNTANAQPNTFPSPGAGIGTLSPNPSSVPKIKSPPWFACL